MKIPGTIPLSRDGQYCIHCASETVSREYRDGKTFYTCTSCGKESDRSIVIDMGVRWWIDANGDYWHESVGVVVIHEGKILCLMRQIYPFAYALPAGHVDAGEEPVTAAVRELREETGIVAEKVEHVANFDLPGDGCRRGSDHHRWNLYKLRCDMRPELQLSDETATYEWFGLDELSRRNDLVYPLAWILRTFGEKLL